MRLSRSPGAGWPTGARARGFPRSIADTVGGILEVLGVMVTVYPLEHFDAHAEKPCGRPKADAVLHHPGCRGMTQSMGGRWRLKAGQFDGALKGSFHRLNRLAVEFDEMLLNDAAFLPAAHVCEQTGRDGHRRLPLRCFWIASCPAIVKPPLNRRTSVQRPAAEMPKQWLRRACRYRGQSG